MSTEWPKIHFWSTCKRCALFEQKISLETQNSILRSNVYTPYLDNRLQFYPFSSNLFTTRNKGKTRYHTVIFLVFRGRKEAALHTRKTTVLSLFFSFCYSSFGATRFFRTHSSSTRTCSKLVARIRRDVIHIVLLPEV